MFVSWNFNSSDRRIDDIGPPEILDCVTSKQIAKLRERFNLAELLTSSAQKVRRKSCPIQFFYTVERSLHTQNVHFVNDPIVVCCYL